jgi:hypothetical protein
MKRLIITALSVVVLAASALGTVSAQPSPRHQFELPKGAIQLADGSYYIGTKRDPKTGKMVDGIAYMHPKRQDVKSSSVGARGGPSCYAFLASGLKWKTPEPWLLDPANSRGLTSDFLLAHTAANLGKWESASSADIFGNGSVANGLSADVSAPDGQNEVLFGSIAESGVIAVTTVWGYYNAPVKYREIVEWDQVFDDQDFDWSATGEAGKMDFDNISTHEVGHAAGMGHPSSACTEETMFAYANDGETKKRDLNAGDIAGINALY